MVNAWDKAPRTRARARARLAREAGPCWICGQPIDYTLPFPDPLSFELDHKKPVITHPELAFDASNHAASHRRCNRAKSDKAYAPIIRRSGALS